MKKVTSDEYVAVLNQRLEAHPNFVPGMRFIPVLQGSKGEEMTGFDWEPKTLLHPFTEVSNAVKKEYSVSP